MSNSRRSTGSRQSEQALPDLPGEPRTVGSTAGATHRTQAVDTGQIYRRSRHRQPLDGDALPRTRSAPRPRGSDFSIVLPQPRQILSQTMPDLLVFVTVMIILAIGPLAPLGVPVWTLAMLIPSLLTFLMADPATRPLWRRTAIVNLLVLGLLFPVLVVRQSVVQVPYLDRSNGTLWPPLLATVGIAIVLVGLALASSVLANEDPEYAGVLFLPAAMLVPMLAGPVDVTDFSTAVFGIALIYLSVAGLTVIASMLPGAYPTLVAPIAIAIEFIALSAYRSGSIFPIGSGIASKLLFFGIVFVAVGLAIAVPTMSLWVREMRRIMYRQPQHDSP